MSSRQQQQCAAVLSMILFSSLVSRLSWVSRRFFVFFCECGGDNDRDGGGGDCDSKEDLGGFVDY